MKKIIDFLDDGFIRLIMFILFWIFFIVYNIIDFEVWTFLYQLVLYIPFTISLLKKSFYFSCLLILILGLVELISVIGSIIACVLDFNLAYILTIIYNLVKFFMYAILYGYIFMKLKNKGFNELKNQYMGKITISITLIFLVLSVANLVTVLNNSDNKLLDVFGYLSSTMLLINQIVFVITSEKIDTFIKKID